MIDTISRDVRHGVRLLLKNPGLSLVAILSIALGVGANAAMFSVADGLLLRPLPVPATNEIVGVSAVTARAGDGFTNTGLLSYADYADLRDRARSFAGLAAYRVRVTGVATTASQPAQTRTGLEVSGNFFDTLRLQPAIGRFFRPDEDRVSGREAVVVLAHDSWVDLFGADPAIVDRRIRLGGVDFTVIGVAPAGFTGMHLALPPTFYIPLAASPLLPGSGAEFLEQRDVRTLTVKGRLARGVSIEQAAQEAALIASSLEQAYPDTNRNHGLLVRSQFDARLEERGPSAPSAFMLMTLALVVLLVACANVAGLFMSRAPAREREIALRLAVGGGRFRVTRQLLTESALLAAVGGALGLALGYGGILLFRQLPMVSDIGVRLTFELDRRVVGVAIALTAASALLSSLVPAWRATRARDLVQTLRVGARRAPSRLWGRNGLVATQVALALMMLTVTVFLSRAFQAELDRPGFRTTGILLSAFEPWLARYDEAQTQAFYERLEDRVRALPGVTSVGMTSVMPLNQDGREPLAIVPRGIDNLTVQSSRIDDGYLATMGIAVVAGRNLAVSDTAATPRVALVSQAMAKRYWPNQNPIGRRIRLVDRPELSSVEVVGVTADTKHNWIGEAPGALMYLAQRQAPGSRSTLVVAAQGDAGLLASPLRDIVRDIDPDMPIASLRTMDAFYEGNAAGIVTTLVRVTGGLGLLGLMLALVGLYALVSFAVAQRTREIGIRMAVGAQPGTVLRMVLGHGAALAGFGVTLGVAGCIAVGGLLRAVFPSTGGIDGTAYLIVIPCLAMVTLLAAYVPARRAARIDPLLTLRQD